MYTQVGGVGEPCLGADLIAQTKMVANYKDGIRITSYIDDYARSFAWTSIVTSARQFYSAHFTTEEAGIHSRRGVPGRIFDAVSNGARGLYFKNLVGVGQDFCSKRFFPEGRSTRVFSTIAGFSSCRPIRGCRRILWLKSRNG